MILWIQNIDNAVLNFIQANLHNLLFDKMMPLISRIGDISTIWLIVAVIFLLIPKYRKYGILIVLAILLAAFTGEVVLKNLVERVRPCNMNTAFPMLIPRPTDFSFPSGHTSASFAAATIIWKAKRKFGIFALLLASLIAFSRLYLYVHYPTDILAGMVLGLLCGLTVIAVIEFIDRKKSLDAEKTN